MNDFWKVHLIYCLKRLDDGSYIALNRYYKPLGLYTKRQLCYFDFTRYKLRMTKKRAIKLSWNNSDNIDIIHFYNDGSIPVMNKDNWESYQNKLYLLTRYEYKYQRVDTMRF